MPGIDLLGYRVAWSLRHHPFGQPKRAKEGLRKHHLLMAHVEDLIEPGAKHVALTCFHDVPRLQCSLQINVLQQ